MATFRTIQRNKGKTVIAIVRIKGYKKVTKTFSGMTLAKEWAQATEVKMRNGTYVEENSIVKEGVKIEYVCELIKYFRDNVAPSRYGSRAKMYDCMYDWWCDKIGTTKVKQLKAPMLSAAKQILLTEEIAAGKTRKPNTINKYLMCISAVLTFAVNELELIEYNPMSKVKTLPKPEGRKRRLSFEELSKFLCACRAKSDIVYLFVLIALGTGGRYSEVQELTVENIDFENSRVYYTDTKNHTSRGVYLESTILEFLQKYLRKNNITTGYIFTGKRKGQLAFLRGEIYKIIKELELSDFRVHDMRHTFASYAAMSGASLLDIAELLGHKSLSMARRYSHLTQKHTDGIVQNFVKKIIPDV